MAKENKQNKQTSSALAAPAAKNSQKEKKNGMPTWVGTLILVGSLVLLIGIVAFSGMYSKGVFLHGKTVAETEHYEVNAAMMSYMVYSEYQNFVSQYSSSDYGNILSYIKGTGGTALSTSTPLRDQYYSKPTDSAPDTETKTWFDYFADSAITSVKQILVYCEVAHQYSIGLDQSEQDAIDATIEQFEITAKAQGYTLNEYLMAMYGKGVTEKEVRRIMELSQLASKTATLKQEEFENAVTELRIDEEYIKNQATYDIYTDYVSYTFTATFEPEDSEDKEAANTAYVADQEKFKARVEELKAATSATDFANLITKWVYDDTYKSEYDQLIASGTEEAEAQSQAQQKAETESVAAAANTSVTAYTKSDDESDLEKWLYDAARAVGDTTTIIQESVAKNADGTFVTTASSTYSAYFLTKTVYHDTGEYLRDVGHILFQTSTFDELTSTETLTGKVKELADKVLARDGELSAEAMAKELLATMLADGKLIETAANGKTYYKIDKAAFEEYGLAYTEDGSVFYEDVAPGDMVTAFNDWLFDEERQEGEISYPSAIETTYGYHIMMYLGGGKTKVWRHQIAETLADADFSAWYEAETARTVVDINDKAMKSITG